MRSGSSSSAGSRPLLIGLAALLATVTLALVLTLGSGGSSEPGSATAVSASAPRPVPRLPPPEPALVTTLLQPPEAPPEAPAAIQDSGQRLDLDTEMQRLGLGEIDLEARAIIAGRVLDGLQQALPRTLVTLFDSRGEQLTATFSDEAGRFRFEAAQPLLAGWSLSTGIATGLAPDDPEATAPASYVHGDDLRPGDPPLEVTLVVAPAPRIEGLVLDGDTGLPATFAMVEVLSRFSAWQASSQVTFTEADASFSVALTQIPARELLIRASGRGTRQVLEGPLSLSPGEVRWIELTLRDPVSLSGRVLDDLSGEGLAGARVTALPVHPLIDAVPQQTVCDSEGRFTLQALTPSSGGQRLHVAAEDHSAELVVASQAGPPLEIRMGPTAMLSGTVHDGPSGLAVRFASVACVLPSMEGAGPTWTDTTLCDEQGHFELPLAIVPPTAALLVVESPGHLLSRRPLADLVPLHLGGLSYELRIDLARTRP